MLKEIQFNELQKIIENDKLSYIYFGASWCGGCQMMKPIIIELAKVKDVYMVNIDKEQSLVEKFKINSIPTIVILKGNQIISQEIGYRPLNYLIERGK